MDQRKRAVARSDCTGKCATLMAEELAARQFGDDRRAVEDDELVRRGARIELVDKPRDQLLARSALADEKNGSRGEPRYLDDLTKNSAPERARADQLRLNGWGIDEIIDSAPALEAGLAALANVRTRRPHQNVRCACVQQLPHQGRVDGRICSRNRQNTAVFVAAQFLQEAVKLLVDPREAQDSLAAPAVPIQCTDANACALQAFEQGLCAGEVLWSTKMKPRLPAHSTLSGMGYARWNSAVLSPSGKNSITSGHFVIEWLCRRQRRAHRTCARCERGETDED